MKAIGYYCTGSDSVLELVEAENPQPGPHDLLISVKAVSVTRWTLSSAVAFHRSLAQRKSRDKMLQVWWRLWVQPLRSSARVMRCITVACIRARALMRNFSLLMNALPAINR